jgi:molybdopterin/thiamine biosynthesis adenylyltransferase
VQSEQHPEPTRSPAERYARQIRFAPLGVDGQAALGRGRVLVCGCGALGSVIANTLARAGVGFLRIVDRDFLELNNLQRQVIYDEQDVRDNLPKAIAAQRRLQQVNSDIQIEAIVTDVNHTNIHELLNKIDVIADGTDNFETRFLLNDASHEMRIPWVYGGCVGAEGQSLTIIPGQTPCFRCIVTEPPPPGTTPTCDSAGILGSIVNVIASIEAAEVLKLLCGAKEAINPGLTIVDLWTNQFRSVNLDNLRDGTECPTCQKGETPWLDGSRASQTAVLCGRDSVQLSGMGSPVALDELQSRLSSFGTVTRNAFLIRACIEDLTITIFHDGRAVIGGTSDPARARTAYARYVGH